MSTVVDSLAPIFFVIALGAALRASGFLSVEFFAGMNRLTYWVALPALLFYKVAGARLEGAAALRIFAVLLAATVVCVVLGVAVALVLGLPRPSVGAFVQASYRGNLLYVGLPVIVFALGAQAGADARDVESTAIVAVAPLVPLYNVVAVVALTLCSTRRERVGLRATVRRILVNPLILACAAGLAFSLAGVRLPAAALRTLTVVGQIALPLALLAIGSSLTFERLREGIGSSAAAAVIKVVVCPALGLALARWWGLGPSETCVALVYLACPTAVASYVMAEQLGCNARLAGSAVVVSTLACFAPLAAIVYYAA
jgi:predicted permease